MDYFKGYHRYMVILEPLDDAARGRLFTACLAYSETGELPDLPGDERLAFCAIRADIDADRVSKPERAKRFVPPTLEEVAAYCRERGNTVNPEEFMDHYAANGWMRGKTKIRDWRACVRTWEKSREKREKERRPRLEKAHNHHQRAYTEAELAEIGVDLLAD